MPKSLLKTLLCGIVAVFGAAGSVAAQGWVPNRPVEFVVPYAVGGGADVFARVIAQVMAEEKLVPVAVQVVNQPGGGSAVGVAYVLANRASNPHTLVLANNPLQATPLTVANAPGLKDLQPIYNFMLDDFIMVVRVDSPYKNAKELIEAGRHMRVTVHDHVIVGSQGRSSMKTMGLI